MMIPLRRFCFTGILTLVLFSGCLSEPPQRQDAFQTLSRWEDQRSAPEDSLLGMLKNDDAHVRLQALRSAGLIGQRSVVPAMIEALDDPSETVARQAAFSLGLMGDPGAVPALEAALSSPGSRIHLAAVKGLAHLQHEGRGLLSATTFKDPDIAAAAWDGLRNVATEVDSTLLIDALIEGLNASYSQVLWRALRCAERLPAPELVPYLAPHIKSGIAQVRVHAFRALSQQDNPQALQAVLSGLNQPAPSQDRHQRTMIAACRALGSLGPHAFYPNSDLDSEQRHLLTEILIESAGSDNSHLAITALAAMEKLADAFELPPEAAQQESLLPVWRIRLSRTALSHLEQNNPLVRAAAIRSWSALRGQGSEDQLLNLLRTTKLESDQEALIYCLGRHGKSPLQVLAAYANSSSSVRLKVAALEALNHLATRPPAHADRSVILNKMTQAAADEDFVIAATAISYLADFPERTSLIAMAEAWDFPYTEGRAEVKRAILKVLESYGENILELKRPEQPADQPDRLLEITRLMLRQAFDSPDLRIRLEGRTTALATGLLPDQLIPGEGSLRATMPPHRRSNKQPAVRLPFNAPDVLCTTDKGTFTIKLDGKTAPNTCAMFLDLIDRGFYDDLIFHRVVPDFVVQGGDPRADGWGGPGFTIRSEWSRIPFERAYVGIAHDGKDTGGSQFFITLSEQPHLNGRYTIFGKVTDGMQVVDEVEKGDHFQFKTRN